jgi:hypothetical protein
MKIGREIWDDEETRDEYIDTMIWEPTSFREKYSHLEYDELPRWVKFSMETHPRKGFVVKTGTLLTDNWIASDGYVEDILRLPALQMDGYGFKEGDRVKITVELIERTSSLEA